MAAEDVQTGLEFAEEFAAFASALTLDQVPSHVLDMAKADVFDTLACAMAGISANGVDTLLSMVVDWGGKPNANIWCTGHRVPAHHAAWVNGMMAHARDFDDTHDAAVLHAGVSVVPAALAAAEIAPTASGADLLSGIVVGLELICRLGMATKIGIVESGYMYTSLFGHFAATAAAARVLRLDAAQTVNALGIAYSQAAGTHQVTRDAALTKRMQPGFAAKTGVISAQLSRAGIRGAQRVFEGADGLFRSYLRSAYDPERLRDGLGDRFDLADLSFKPYPCCRFNHTAIDAALKVRADMPVGAKIHKITARVTSQSREAVGTPIEMRRAPKSVVQAQFSIPYTVACALHKGALGLVEFTDDALQDERVLDIASCVDVLADPEIDREWGRKVSPTHLVVETDQGVFEARADIPRGSAETPMTRSDFDRKLNSCVDMSGLHWPEDLARKLSSAIDGLAEGQPNDLFDLLAR